MSDILTFAQLVKIAELVQHECARLQQRVQMYPEFEEYRQELEKMDAIQHKISILIKQKTST